VFAQYRSTQRHSPLASHPHSPSHCPCPTSVDEFSPVRQRGETKRSRIFTILPIYSSCIKRSHLNKKNPANGTFPFKEPFSFFPVSQEILPGILIICPIAFSSAISTVSFSVTPSMYHVLIRNTVSGETLILDPAKHLSRNITDGMDALYVVQAS
jgi:hypothetical protein